MGYPTKVQLIKRKESEQWYINFPSAVAQAMEFAKGETVHWLIEDKETLALVRPDAPKRRLKKKQLLPSSKASKSSGTKPKQPVKTKEPRKEQEG